VAALTATLAFLVIMTPTANMDNPLFKNTVVRKAYTESELQATETILELTDGDIATDGGPATHLTLLPQFPPSRIVSLVASLWSKDFTDHSDSIIMIRQEISQGIIATPVDSFVRLDYDPAQFLADEDFSRIYASGSVSAFYWNSKQPPSQEER